jgi:hypothetical protein
MVAELLDSRLSDGSILLKRQGCFATKTEEAVCRKQFKIDHVSSI